MRANKITGEKYLCRADSTACCCLLSIVAIIVTLQEYGGSGALLVKLTDELVQPQNFKIVYFDHISRTAATYTKTPALLQSPNHHESARPCRSVIGRVY